MAKGTNQHLKLYYLALILMQKTDADHGLTMEQIIKALDGYGVSADRKALYENMEDLMPFGIEVGKTRKGNLWYYNVISRPIELSELKLLVDSIQSSKFIAENRSAELIGKLSKMVSEYEARTLSRQVFVKDRPKTSNDKSFYNVDSIHEAIAAGKKIKFKYFNWTTQKTKEYHHGEGYYYVMSPWAMCYQEENYYLIAYDSEGGKVRHFRVDKMEKVTILDELRDGADQFKQFNLPVYLRQTFGMFGADEATDVKLRIKNDAAGIFIDRFGTDISFKPDGEGFSTFYVKIRISDQFFSWIFALGEMVKIIGPESVVEQAKKFIGRLDEMYLGE